MAQGGSNRGQVLAALAAMLWGGWLAAVLWALQVSLAQQYFAAGFGATVVFLAAEHLARTLLPAAGAVGVIALLTARVARRRPERAAGFAATLTAGAGGLAFFLAVGYGQNRHRFPSYWTRGHELGPLRVPEALFQGEVWRANLLVTLGALAIAAAILLLLWLAVLRRPSAAERAARRLAHPVSLLLAVALIAGTPALAGLLRQRAADLPNIILVSLDTLRADRLGVYGCELPTSPRIDALAGESVLFEWAVAQAPNTPPSHMSIFTSLYPTIHGFQGSGDRLAGWRLTLTEHLRDAGYRTLATTDGGFMRAWFGFGQGFERFDDRDKGIARSVPLVFDWLDRGRAQERFFVFLHCYDVHSPYDPPPPYRDLYTDPEYTGGFHPGSQELERIRKAVNENPSAGHGLSAADVAYIRARYDGGVTYTDAWVGRLVDGLRERGLLKNTWLIVTSDHGEEFTEHGSVLHEKLYHTVTHVPLIIRPPDDPRLAGGAGERRGARVAEVVELIDLMPTAIELAGRAPAGPVQGASLRGLLEGVPGAWKNTAHSELPWYGKQRARTTPDLHILTSLESPSFEVYRYREDPLEQRPLPDGVWTAEIPSEARALLDWSAEQILAAAGQRRGTTRMELDEETERQLRALGYIQ